LATQIIKLTEWTGDIVNSVEEDLRKELKRVILENPNWGWEQISIQDVYGCAINQLTPYYVRRGVKANFHYSQSELNSVLQLAMKRVKANPIHISRIENK
jgi:hypothetical protein